MANASEEIDRLRRVYARLQSRSTEQPGLKHRLAVSEAHVDQALKVIRDRLVELGETVRE